MVSYKCEVAPGIYTDRALGRYRDHRHPGRAIVAGALRSQGKGRRSQLHEQSKAVANRLAPLCG